MRVILYAEANVSPLRTFLLAKRFPSKAGDKFAAVIRRLAAFGADLRRPIAAPLRDGIHELRVDHQNVEYRILYFFDGEGVVVLSHAIVKPGAKVPPKQIDLAVARKAAYIADRPGHTYVAPAVVDTSTQVVAMDATLAEIGPSQPESARD